MVKRKICTLKSTVYIGFPTYVMLLAPTFCQLCFESKEIVDVSILMWLNFRPCTISNSFSYLRIYLGTIVTPIKQPSTLPQNIFLPKKSHSKLLPPSTPHITQHHVTYFTNIGKATLLPKFDVRYWLSLVCRTLISLHRSTGTRKLLLRYRLTKVQLGILTVVCT